MKRFITVVVLAMFTAAISGCKASAEVGDPDDGNTSSYKKTTVKEPDGDTTTKIETKTK